MHALLYVLEQRRSVLRGLRRQVESGCATARAVSGNLDVLTSIEGHIGGAAGARARGEWDVLTANNQAQRDIGRCRRTFQRQHIHQQRVWSRLGGADRKADQHLACILAESEVIRRG